MINGKCVNSFFPKFETKQRCSHSTILFNNKHKVLFSTIMQVKRHLYCKERNKIFCICIYILLCKNSKEVAYQK